MVNILIADDNIHYATNLMNYLNKSNNNLMDEGKIIETI